MDNTGDSILNSIKKLFGPDTEYTHFDPDLILHINSVFSTLTQLGVGPKEGFSITGASETWDDFFDGVSDVSSLLMVKSYIYLKVRLLFDPPVSSAVIESINRQIGEYEWRLFVAADPSQ